MLWTDYGEVSPQSESLGPGSRSDLRKVDRNRPTRFGEPNIPITGWGGLFRPSCRKLCWTNTLFLSHWGSSSLEACAVLSCSFSAVPLCDPMDCSPPGTSVQEGSPGKNTGVGCHALLQGIFLTQGSNPGLLHCRQILYYLSHLKNGRREKRRWGLLCRSFSCYWQPCLFSE